MNNIEPKLPLGNRHQILARLQPGRPLSRGQLVDETALSQATVFRVTRQLLKEKVITEGAPEGSSVGRPSPALILNHDYASVLGLSLSMRTARALRMSLNGEVEEEKSADFDWRDGAATIQKVLAEVARGIIRSGRSKAKLNAAALAIPGQWNEEQGRSVTFPRVSDWHNVPIREHLEKLTGLPVSLVGYAPALALAEQQRRGGAQPGSLLCVEVEENVAMGIVVNGKPWQGANGNAGELGHSIVDKGGLLCYCGNHGCLETLATCQAVEAAYGQAGTGRHNNDSEVGCSYEEIVAQARAGQHLAVRVLSHAATALGQGAATAINFFNPEVMVFSGRFFEAGDWVMKPLLQTIHQRAFPVTAQAVRLEPSPLGANASARGAGIQAIQQALQKI